MIILGLTGSIGMGKSTTAAMFRDEGVPVHDSDEAVHRLYAGQAVPLVEARFPGVTTNGKIDRDKLSQHVVGDRQALADLEAIIHPLVRKDADDFLDRHRRQDTPLVLLDIPLLFETGGRDRVDKIVVVTASGDIQRERVLARPGMTAEKFEKIHARQVPDAQKRAQADFIIDTGHGMAAARDQVRAIIAQMNR